MSEIANSALYLPKSRLSRLYVAFVDVIFWLNIAVDLMSAPYDEPSHFLIIKLSVVVSTPVASSV